MRLGEVLTVIGDLRTDTRAQGHARRARVEVLYNNKNISTDIAPYFINMSYTDNMDGQADDLQITLEDTAGLWRGDWIPEKGASLTASIVYEYWHDVTDGPIVSSLGTFEVDEIEVSGPASVVTVKAVSVPDASALRGVERSKSWDKVNIKQIAAEKTKDAGLKLFYDTEENPVLERVEQSEESDLLFLYRLCKDNGLALKVTDQTVAIFEATKFEQLEPVIGIAGPAYTAGGSVPYYTPISYHFKTSTKGIYKTARVDYQDGKTKKHVTATFTDPDKKEGKTLINHDQVKDEAEALRKAKKLLREKNKNEFTGSITVMGDPAFYAGATVNVKGFGHFDGVYIVERVAHSLGSGYSCTLDIRRVLHGY